CKDGMVVSVKRNVPAFLLVGSKETDFAFSNWNQPTLAVAALQTMSLKKLALFVQHERARILPLVDHVRVRPGRHHHRARRQFNDLSSGSVLSVNDRLALKLYGLSLAPTIGDAFDWTEKLGKIDSLFERFDHFFVIETVGG